MRFKPVLIPVFALLLTGCNTAKVQVCPYAAVLEDASQMTQFRTGAPQDLSGEAYTVYITGIDTDCNYDKKRRRSDSSATLHFRATRAPTAQGAEYSIPYFLAVTQTDRILSKQIFTVTFRFAPGQSVATFDDRVGETVIEVEPGHQSTDYQLTAGLQLTEAQQAYSKKRGPYVP